MPEITINLNLTIGELTEENEKRIVSLIKKVSKTTKTTTNVQTKKKTTMNSNNSEKEIGKEVMDKITENPDTIFAKVVESILGKRLVALQELYEEFSEENSATIRSYVHDLKQAGILKQYDVGKYVVEK